MKRAVWFQLVNEEGIAVTSADFVDVPDKANVARFRKAVNKEYSSHLEGVAASDLTVFSSRAAYDAKEALPKASLSVKDLGMDEDNPLIVVVPTPRQVLVPPAGEGGPDRISRS